MVGIFEPIKKEVPTFAMYLKFMFEEHTCFAIGSRSKDGKKIPFDELMAE